MKKLKLFLLIFFFLQVFLKSEIAEKKRFLVMLDPAGHANNVGRKLIEDYERTQTFNFAQELQKRLRERYKIWVVITRYLGEEVVELQNASFSNRINADLYIHISMYREENIKPTIFMYHLVYNPLVDFAKRIFDPYDFIPINQAHFANINLTTKYANYMKNYLTQPNFQRWFDLYGFFGIPFKPLVGITAPAIAIELGICQEDKWKIFIEPLVESLSFLSDN
ncbi:MAG: hypothetical protein WC436_00920 [Candidatus Babeliales bacterium]